MAVVVPDLPPGGRWRLYRAGALLVTGGVVPAGCLRWSRPARAASAVAPAMAPGATHGGRPGTGRRERVFRRRPATRSAAPPGRPGARSPGGALGE